MSNGAGEMITFKHMHMHVSYSMSRDSSYIGTQRIYSGADLGGGGQRASAPL